MELKYTESRNLWSCIQLLSKRHYITIEYIKKVKENKRSREILGIMNCYEYNTSNPNTKEASWVHRSFDETLEIP